MMKCDMVMGYDDVVGTDTIIIAWFDVLIWHDMTGYDMIWYDMVWCDMIWYDVTKVHDMISMIRYDSLDDTIQ